MRRIGSKRFVILALVSLAACSEDATRNYGVGRGGQEQIGTMTPAPLSLPPILTETRLGADASRAPGPGDTAPMGGVAPARPPLQASAPPSAGKSSLLDAAGPSAPGDIRDRVDQDAQIGRADPGYSDALLFGPTGPRAGQPPIIQREPKSWYDGIL